VSKPLVDVLGGQIRKPPPVWLMRQAGRYLPEYQALRARSDDFLNLCLTPELAAEITLQPIRRFGFDAAILFSDILVVPYALGQRVWFVEGEGPRLEPVAGRSAIEDLQRRQDRQLLQPVYEAITRVKESLPPTVALLGFCGGPWTVATYMVAGRSTPDQSIARLFAYDDPEGFSLLIDMLVECSANHLIRQFAAGADAVQIFDTWAGTLAPCEFERWCVVPMCKLIEKLRTKVPTAKVIGFPRGIGSKLSHFTQAVPVDAISLDWTVDLEFASRHIPDSIAVQGNLDPVALLAGGEALDRNMDRIMAAFCDRPFIFNLGHGVLPQTPLVHVERMLARIRKG
jgi:uroporphyrinogen decarboxylase